MGVKCVPFISRLEHALVCSKIFVASIDMFRHRLFVELNPQPGAFRGLNITVFNYRLADPVN